jgi:hypothetical protein
MVVLNAVRCNPWLRQYYERLRAAGKPSKVAVIAAMRKLLAAVWSVAKHRRRSCRDFPPRLPEAGQVDLRSLLHLFDDDMLQFLDSIKQRRRQGIDAKLEGIFGKLIQ